MADEVVYVRKQNRIVRFFKGSFEELRKVTWPTRSLALNLLILVVVISLLVAGFIAALDYLFTKGYEQLLQWFPPAITDTVDPTSLPAGTTTGPITIPAGTTPEGAIPITIPSQ